MKHQVCLVRLLALIFGSFSVVQSWTTGICHQQDCPEFTVTETNEDFEERAYKPSCWITVNIPGADKESIKAGFYKLYDFCNGQNDNGVPLPCKFTWPSLVSMTQGEDGVERDVSVSFYVPPGMVLPNLTDPNIIEETWPETTLYVRAFGGIPSLSSGESNVKQLWESLTAAGKTFVPQRYTGAGYDSPWSLFHHNEVWAQAA